MICISEADDDWWSTEWKYRQQLIIPFDTSLEQSMYQPIDTRVEFDNTCWGQNETLHSIRVLNQHENDMRELESQIYDINFSSDGSIVSCSLVFLIPPFADGKESYFIYYNDKTTPSTEYPDHVSVREAYYRYEPIPGYPFESGFFEIKQHGNILYSVSYQGEFLGLGTAHQITKFLNGTKEVTNPKNAEAWASFDFYYVYGHNIEDFSSTIQELISKEIFIDGNLMVKVGIVSGTPLEDVQTTGEYKYYYCPMEAKRIHAHVIHEALKDFEVLDSEAIGNIGGLQVGLMKSPSIGELNFGRMFPYMHVYHESDVINEYILDMDPEYTPEGIPILEKHDDVDFGKKAWSSFDDGESGEAHAIIFSSNTSIISGTNERDGLQVNALEGATPGLLGLETDLVSFYFSRNGFENDLPLDLSIPADFVSEFDAEFVTTYDGGYLYVDKESEIFQALASIKPADYDEEYVEEESVETFDLTAFIHLAPSSPMGTSLSILSGLNFSYITGELYRTGAIESSDVAERIPLGSSTSHGDDGLIQKIRSFIDWRNITFFKKVSFQNLKPDVYLLKIYRENPLIGHERKFIGFSIVDLQKDMRIHMLCKKEADVKIEVRDQFNKNIDNAEVVLKFDDVIISKTNILKDGVYHLSAPYFLTKTYLLQVFHNGFLLHAEPVKLGYLRTILPQTIDVESELHDFNLIIKDTWGLHPEYKINPVLTSNEMYTYQMISSLFQDQQYQFKELNTATYDLEIKFKSFLYEETIDIPYEDDLKIIEFPATYTIDVSFFDERGSSLDNNHVTISREEKMMQLTCDDQGVITTSLPPGTYLIKTYNENDEVIAKRNIEIIGERSYEIVTTEPSFMIAISIIMLTIFMGIVGCILIKKHEQLLLIRFFMVYLLLFSILVPWWGIYGVAEHEDLEASTSMFIFPPSLISMTESSEVIAGSRGLDFLPDHLMQILYLFSGLIVLSCALVLSASLFDKKNMIRIAKLVSILAMVLLIITNSIFYIGVSAISKLGIGSFFGNGPYEVTIPGEAVKVTTTASWGPTIGFYVCILSILAMVFLYLWNYTNVIEKVFKK